MVSAEYAVSENQTFESPYFRGLIAMGCKIERLTDGLSKKSVFRITTPSGGRWLSGGNASYPFNSERTYAAATNKLLMYGIAIGAGIVIPATVAVTKDTNLDEAVEFSAQQGWNVIVKPNDAFDAAGLSIHMCSQGDLITAIQKAQQHSVDGRVLVQQKLAWEEYRFTVFRGKVCSVLRRRKLQFVGDGVSSTGSLLDKENELRQYKNTKYERVVTPLLNRSVICNHDLGRVLPAGEVLVVGSSDKVLEGGALLEEVIDDTDQSYISIAEKLANEICGQFVAVDMFIQDPAVRAQDSSYSFNEVNAAPASFYYYAARGKDDGWIVDKLVAESIKVIDLIRGCEK